MAEATELSRWLQAQMDRRSLSQLHTALMAGVGVGTLNDIIRQGHVPKIDTLFRLADFFGTSRARLLLMAANITPEEAKQMGVDHEDFLVDELLDEFRRLPDEWKQEAVSQVRFLNRLAGLPPVRFVGDEAAGRRFPDREGSGSEDEA